MSEFSAIERNLRNYYIIPYYFTNNLSGTGVTCNDGQELPVGCKNCKKLRKGKCGGNGGGNGTCGNKKQCKNGCLPNGCKSCKKFRKGKC